MCSSQWSRGIVIIIINCIVTTNIIIIIMIIIYNILTTKLLRWRSGPPSATRLVRSNKGSRVPTPPVKGCWKRRSASWWWWFWRITWWWWCWWGGALFLFEILFQACRGHCGYPVTHFWRHVGEIAIFFQVAFSHFLTFLDKCEKSSQPVRKHVTDINYSDKRVPRPCQARV